MSNEFVLRFSIDGYFCNTRQKYVKKISFSSSSHNQNNI